MKNRNLRAPLAVLPLAMLDAPCPLRDIVTAALDKKGMAWRHAFNSASLSAVWAATAIMCLGFLNHSSSVHCQLCLPQ